jgi:hypothetical protein
MLPSDWLTLIGEALLVIGVSGWALFETSRGTRAGAALQQGRVPRPSLAGTISNRLHRWSSLGGLSAILGASGTERSVQAPELTEEVCRLADGSVGRVAIVPGTGEEWTAVCVPA